MSDERDISRRSWLKAVGAAGAAMATGGFLTSCLRRGGSDEWLSMRVSTDNEDKNPFDADKIVDALPDETDCIRCGRCMPCGYGVDIPAMYAAYNEAVRNGGLPRTGSDFTNGTGQERSREFVRRIEREIGDKHLAHRCACCGGCMKNCPKKLPIARDMRNIGRLIDLTRETE